MKISDMVSMCLGNLFRRKMRTILTVIGVVVGTCSIVIMISLGIGMTESMNEKLAMMGDLTMIHIYNYSYGEQEPDTVTLDDQTIAQIQQIPGVEVASPIYRLGRFSASLLTGKNDRYKSPHIEIQGLSPDAFEKLGYELLEGEFPQTSQNNKQPIQYIAGEEMDFNFWDSKSKRDGWRWAEYDEAGNITNEPYVNIFKDEIFLSSKDPYEEEDNTADLESELGSNKDKTVHIRREVKAVGRVKTDWDKGYATMAGMLMTIEDVQKLEAQYVKDNKIKLRPEEKNTTYNEAIVKTADMNDVEAVEAALKQMGFEEISSMESIRKPMQENVQQQQTFLGLMGIISLVVAAIGITNTMIMSIYERTREIGVMKVLGCNVGNIRSVFLLEAGTIGFLGGCAGVLVSFGISYAMNHFGFSTGMDGGMGDMMYYYGSMEETATAAVSIIPMWLAAASVGFATLIGLVSGIIPANRAMKISALEAIKHE